MYIKYDRNSRSVDSEEQTNYRLSVTGGHYRPTWLIRVSDWEKVPGQEAVDGYHALSYCWEESGNVVKRNDNSGEYDCIDKGYHCIVEYVKKRKMRNFFRHYIKKYVKYEKLLQQLCKDFQVEYLWYDKVCIDPSDTKAKLREIKEMDKIYRNARYTIAMVPRVGSFSMNDRDPRRSRIDFDIGFSRWVKRSWTLQEVMMSKRILVVGTNTSMFQYSLHTTDIPTTEDRLSTDLLDFAGQETGSVNQVLQEAHFRTSRKPHDMIFALTNIFPQMFDDIIDINYDTDIKATFNNFYRTIALNDLSILCFQSNRVSLDPRENTMGNYNLPSWTGVAGRHIAERVDSTTHSQLTCSIDPDTMWMYFTTRCYWDISVEIYSSGSFGPLVNKQQITDTKFKLPWRKKKVTRKEDVFSQKLSTITKVSINTPMTHYYGSQHNPFPSGCLLSLTEDCKEVIVLPILFTACHPLYKSPDGGRGINVICEGYYYTYFLPVFRKCLDGTGRYKAIGVFSLGRLHMNPKCPIFGHNCFVDKPDVPPDNIKLQEVLDNLFEKDYHDNVPKQFIIE